MGSPRQPPTFARSKSFKSPLPRGAARNHDLTSGTSLPPFTGDTPPTRDVKVKRSRSSVNARASSDVRKSLESRLVLGSSEVRVSSGTSEPRIVPEGNEPRLLSGTTESRFVSGIRDLGIKSGTSESRVSSGSSESRLMSRQLSGNSTLAAVADSKLQRELEDYFQKYGSIQSMLL